MGSKSNGTIYIRGLKSAEKNIDSFKFILEKANDFCELDSDIMILALDEVNKMLPQVSQITDKKVLTNESGFN